MAALLLAACTKPPSAPTPGRTLIPVFDRGKWGYIDRTGAMRIAPAYEYAAEFSEGLAAVTLDGAIGFIDETGKLVMPARFDRASDFRDGRAPASLKGRDGVVDRAGEFKECTADELRALPRAIPFDPMQRGLSDNRAVFAASDGKLGYMDAAGHVVIPAQYEAATMFRGGVAPVVLGAQWLCIDTAGKVIWQPEFPLSGESLAWNHEQQRATLAASIRRAAGLPFTVELAQPDKDRDALRITFRSASDVLYGWLGHSQTVFEIYDGVLYHADFSPAASGCRVVAFELRNRKLRWTTQLYAAGISLKPKPTNSVDLTLRDGSVVVCGDEWRRYVEVIDAKSGRILGHRIVK